jgi:glyoxylase-like metal-dependent hydrolase (beta-lactamase superfamily II)
MDLDRLENPLWFNTKEIESDIYLTTENYYYEGNRANMWLIRGTNRDIIIDTGLGVCNLKKHLERLNLLDSTRECIVILTHAHFDHSGGAHHFDNVLIHQNEYEGLTNGEESLTLNWSQSSHYREQPYPEFQPDQYKVPPTKCKPIQNGYRINLSDDNDDHLEIIHVPGHTPGSIICYYQKKNALFTGDFIYECGHGSSLYDWTPRASIDDYLKSAQNIIDWLNQHQIDNIYPGHYHQMNTNQVQKLLNEYIHSKTTKNN